MTTTDQQTIPSALTRDQRGSMLVVGIPMGLFLTAVTWHLLGVCDAALLAEYLRFTADKTAFESAIWHSRGMNILAMLNVLMTALSAVWIAWNILENTIGFAGYLCRVPTAPYCNGHTEQEAIDITDKMASGNGAVRAWFRAQAVAISDLQKATSSVTPTIAMQQTLDNGNGPMSGWLAFSAAISTAQVPDDNLAALTGQPHVSNSPRMGVASSLPALPVEATAPSTFCDNIPALVPDVAGQLSTRLGGYWALEAHDGVGYDWRTQFPITANSMACLGFANNVDVAGIWAVAQHDTQQIHQYAFAVWGVSFGKVDRSEAIDSGVRVGSDNPPGGFSPKDPWTVSQAEFYYDCGGRAWSTCQDDALLNPGWTARLRRVHKPDPAVQGLMSFVALPTNITSSMPPQVHSALFSNGGAAVWDRLRQLVH